MDSLIAAAIIVVLIGLNGLFVAAEFAIVGAPRLTMTRRAAQGERLARLARDILHDPVRQDRFLATAQLGITFSSLGLGMYGEHALAEWIAGRLEGLGAARWIAAHAAGSVMAVAGLTYLHIVLGEMVPKSLALQRAERTALALMIPMLPVRVVLYPIVIVVNAIGNGVLRTVGVDRRLPSTERFHTPEELQWIVRESERGGVLDPASGRMLQELFEFGELTAGQVMVPRVRIVGIPVGMAAERVRSLIRSAPHTRYPIFEGDLDRIVGVVHVKDLLRPLLAGEAIEAVHARPMPLVPETTPLDVALAAMRRSRAQAAVVIDEHGGTAGLLTLEDLFEEVVGDIEETRQSAAERAGMSEGPGVVRVAGTVRLDELGERLGRELGHDEVDSVSGLVLTILGRPPVVSDAVEYGGLRFDVAAVHGRGVRECIVTVLPRTRSADPS